MSAPLVACLGLAAMALGAQAPLPADAQPGQRLELDAVLRLALERSPQVAGAEATTRAMRQRIVQAGALPDPMLSVGWAGRPVPFDTMAGDASSYRGLSISQQFPYPGKRRLATQVAARDAEAATSDCESARRQLARSVRMAFAEYFYADRTLEVTLQNKQLLERLTEIAESQYRVGKAMQQDVLRAQVEQSMLLARVAELEQKRAEAVSELNTAMRNAPDQPLARPGALPLARLRGTLDQLQAAASAQAPDLARDRASIARDKASLALASLGRRPDIGVGYMFEQRTGQADMHGLTVTVNLPEFHRRRLNAAVGEAAESERAAEQTEQAHTLAIRNELGRQVAAAHAAEQLIDLYQQAIVPQSSLTLESAMGEYQVGKLDFLSVLTNFTTVLNYETDYYRQLADHEIAIANIESLTGALDGIVPAAASATQADRKEPGSHD